MSIKNILIGLILSALVLGPLMGTAVANVPGVAINAPPPPPSPNVAVQGGQGLFKVVVSHRDTMIPATHYVDHVYLYDGDKLLKEWKYTESNANPNEVYTESLVLPASGDMDLKAIAHCTLHGYSLADVAVTVLPAGTKPADMVTMNANIAGTQVNGLAPDKAASAAGTMVQQDAALLKQIEASEMPMIQQHQMQTAQFFQTADGKKFLDAFDYTKKMAAVQPAQAPPGAAPVTKMQRDLSGMRTGAGAAGPQAGTAGQPVQGQKSAAGQPATGTANAPQGIPQTVWTDSMGNSIDARQAYQLGQAAAKAPSGQAGAAGQTAAGQGPMPQGAGGAQQPAAGAKTRMALSPNA